MRGRHDGKTHTEAPKLVCALKSYLEAFADRRRHGRGAASVVGARKRKEALQYRRSGQLLTLGNSAYAFEKCSSLVHTGETDTQPQQQIIQVAAFARFTFDHML